jgi:hypothetical protein
MALLPVLHDPLSDLVSRSRIVRFDPDDHVPPLVRARTTVKMAASFRRLPGESQASYLAAIEAFGVSLPAAVPVAGEKARERVAVAQSGSCTSGPTSG